MDEIILKSQSIYKGRVVSLNLLDVKLPNGEQAKREIIQHPGAVAIVALDAQKNVLLVRQYRTAAQKSLLEIPAGTLKPNEDPALCAERELQEETGYKPNKLQAIGGIYTAPGYTSEFIHLFIATHLHESRLAMDDDEFIEVERLPLAEALKRIETGLLRAARLNSI
jgi:ADP-ribose pyrophosphatase